MSSDFSELIGKKIITLFKNKCEDASLYFVCQDTKTTKSMVYTYSTMGDCCNSVWFEHISNPEFMFGGIVHRTIVREWESANDHPDNIDCLDIGFWEIHTNKGISVIEVRNSSNGYYGGDVMFCGITDELPINDLILLKEIVTDF